VRALVFTPDRNAPGKHDHTGAFWPEARAFAKLHGVPYSAIHAVDVSRLDEVRRAHVLEVIGNHPQRLTHLALFCHGLRGRVQLGFRSAHVAELALALAWVAEPDLTVALYCCDVARDDDAERDDDRKTGPGGIDGFAARLRDALIWAGLPDARVFGHATPGHTTRNPWLRVFRAPRGAPGDWVVDPASPVWRRWRKALAGDLRLRFPAMLVEDVRTEVADGA
jgi:hypothetical protein